MGTAQIEKILRDYAKSHGGRVPPYPKEDPKDNPLNLASAHSAEWLALECIRLSMNEAFAKKP
jgi:hypothetical protein